MKNPHPIKACRWAALALGVLLGGTVVPRSAAAPPSLRITHLEVNPDGTVALEWEGADQGVTVQFTAGLGPAVWQPVPGSAWPVDGTQWTGFVPMSPGHGFLRVATATGGATTPLPAKTISLNLMSWHDPQSSSYIGTCTACHGDRTDEVGLDGETKAAHSIMEGLFGTGDARCVKCHHRGTPAMGPNFLTYSTGALREQVNYEEKLCTTCHAKGGAVPLYDR